MRRVHRSFQPALLALALLVVSAIACGSLFDEDDPSPAPVVQSQNPGTFETDACPFETPDGAEITCGYLTVPENRSRPGGRAIQLAVAILHSRSSSPQPDPILYLEGGPGGSALGDPDTWLESPLLDERDIILLDQRGTGYSVPNLNCVELEELDEAGDTVEAAQVCRDRLARDGIDLAQYNSAASAADVNDLRLALGYESWNLLGVSYGTRLALTVMRDFPAGIRSVILDSVYPPEVDAYTEQPLNILAAIQALLDGCEADAACNGAYPDLSNRFYELVEDLNDNPVELDDGEPFDGNALLDLLVDALYDTYTIPLLPQMIDALYYEDYEPLYELLGGDETDGFRRRGRFQEEEDIFDSEGAFYSVECHEEVPFGNLEQAGELLAPYPDSAAQKVWTELEEMFAICRIWGAGQPNGVETQSVRSDIPTLILVGEYDPVTPPRWGQIAAKSLSRHYYFEVPRGGHALLDAGDCPMSLILAFLNQPQTQPDGRCLKADRLDFVVP